MPISLSIGEDELRRMPEELREALLKWYLDTRPIGSQEGAGSSFVVKTKADPIAPNGLDGAGDSGRRVIFPELVAKRLLRPGDRIWCKALKRQQRKGSEPYIEGATVSADGSVEFQGRRFTVPSQLALAMVNAGNGKAKALNGYDYLFVQTARGMASLEEIRKELGAT